MKIKRSDFMKRLKFFWIGLLLFSHLLHAQYIKVESNSGALPKPQGISGTPLINTPELMEYLDSFGEQTYAKSLNKAVNYEVGTTKSFYVYNIKEGKFESIVFTLMAKGSLSQVWCSNEELDNGHLTQAVADTFLLYLENKTGKRSVDPNKGVVAIDQQYFGEPPDKDGDGLVDALLCDIKDGWSSGSSGGYVAGFFHPQDQTNVANSNKADIIYLDSYPGIYYSGHVNPNGALSTIAHEYQHLIHFNYDRSEYTFVNEGLSLNAEYITGLETRESHSYFSDINVPIFRWDRDNSLPDYSRAAIFYNYVGDRFGLENYKYHTQDSLAGPAGFNAALDSSGYPDVDLSEVIHDFHIANLVNDRSLDERYGYLNPDRSSLYIPEQNNRKVFSEAGNTGNINLYQGAAAYLTFENIDAQEANFSFPENARVTAVAYQKDGTVDVFPLTNNAVFIINGKDNLTMPKIHYILSNVTPSGNGDSYTPFTNISWTINGAKAFHYQSISTYGQQQSNSYWAIPYYNSSNTGRFGFTNKFVMPEDGQLAQLSLYILSGTDSEGNAIEVKGTGKLRIAVVKDNGGLPDAVMAEDTIDFKDIQPLWNFFDIESWNLDVKKGDVLHTLYEVIVPEVDNKINSIPLRLDAGDGEQNVTMIITSPGNYEPMFSAGEGNSQNGVWNALIYKVGGAEAPRNVVAEDGDGQVYLSWEKSLYSDFKMYKIYGGLSSNPKTVLDSVMFADSTNAVISGLENGKKYYFTITVVGNDGKESLPSEEVTAVPMSRAVADIELGVLQNPIFTEYIDIFLSSNEELDPTSVAASLSQGGSALAIGLVNKDGTNKVFQNTKQKLRADGDITIIARIRLLESVAYAYDTLSFFTKHLTKEIENRVSSYDREVKLVIKENTIKRDFRMLVIAQGEKFEKSGDEVFIEDEKYLCVSPSYFFSPADRRFDGQIQWNYDGNDGKNIFLAQKEGDVYHLIPTRFDEINNKIYGDISGSGSYVLLRSLNGRENLSSDLPREFSLEPNYPNPFNPQTTIKFSLPHEKTVRLEIFNTMGQRIKTLFNGSLTAGYHRFVWDGRNDNNEAVSSGIYFYRLQAGGEFNQIRKMMLIR
jgi:hypothetical protein